MLDPEFLRALEVQSYLAVPLESSDGTSLGTLCAVGTETGLFNQDHVELLTLSGRLLTYEWESVKWRADLRRLEEAAARSRAHRQGHRPAQPAELHPLGRP